MESSRPCPSPGTGTFLAHFSLELWTSNGCRTMNISSLKTRFSEPRPNKFRLFQSEIENDGHLALDRMSIQLHGLVA
jgi:hypothetical protein